MTVEDLKLRIDYYKELRSYLKDSNKQIEFLKNKGWPICCKETTGNETDVKWGTSEVHFSTYSLFIKYLDEAERSAEDLFEKLKGNGTV